MTRLVPLLAALGAALALAVGAGWLWLGRGADDFAACGSGTVTGQAAIGGPFTLVDESGATVTEAEVIDRPALVYFGYTFCPDVCPLDAARNARAVDLLAERGFEVKPVFVTIDPARDTPEVLAEFTDYMHPDMQGLTGSDEQIRAAAQAYRVYYSRRGDDPDTYLMDHSVFSYLMLPERGFVTLFRGAPGAAGPGVTAEEVAEEAACYLENA